jgi:hypothetical protein
MPFCKVMHSLAPSITTGPVKTFEEPFSDPKLPNEKEVLICEYREDEKRTRIIIDKTFMT